MLVFPYTLCNSRTTEHTASRKLRPFGYISYPVWLHDGHVQRGVDEMEKISIAFFSSSSSPSSIAITWRETRAWQWCLSKYTTYINAGIFLLPTIRRHHSVNQLWLIILLRLALELPARIWYRKQRILRPSEQLAGVEIKFRVLVIVTNLRITRTYLSTRRSTYVILPLYRISSEWGFLYVVSSVRIRVAFIAGRQISPIYVYINENVEIFSRNSSIEMEGNDGKTELRVVFISWVKLNWYRA